MEAKYLRIVDIYWHIKTFIRNIILYSEDEREEIQKQLVEVPHQIELGLIVHPNNMNPSMIMTPSLSNRNIRKG
jgi:hypothetical protein